MPDAAPVPTSPTAAETFAGQTITDDSTGRGQVMAVFDELTGSWADRFTISTSGTVAGPTAVAGIPAVSYDVASASTLKLISLMERVQLTKNGSIYWECRVRNTNAAAAIRVGLLPPAATAVSSESRGIWFEKAAAASVWRVKALGSSTDLDEATAISAVDGHYTTLGIDVRIGGDLAKANVQFFIDGANVKIWQGTMTEGELAEMLAVSGETTMALSRLGWKRIDYRG